MRILFSIALSLSPLPAHAQSYITPEQARLAVRDFCGQPNLPVEVRGFYEDGVLRTREWAYYRLEVVSEDSFAGVYTVRGTAPVVFFMLRRTPSTGEQPPAFTVDQARVVAEQFARSRHPQFDQLHWSSHTLEGQEYQFTWTQVLNQFGTLAPSYLWINVNPVTGEVTHYQRPHDRVTGPTVPQVTLPQATQLAAPSAPFDPNVVPFSAPLLQLNEDVYGIQWLSWVLRQYPNAADTETWYGISVDATTVGVGGWIVPLGSGSVRGMRKPKPALRLVGLRTLNGEPIRSEAPRLRGGRLWIRAELLRGLGAKVEIGKSELGVRTGPEGVSRSIAGSAVGAEYRDYGWWVPLRKVVETLGWRVHWNAKTLEAVVDSGISQPAN